MSSISSSEKQSLTREEFCARNSISKFTYYKMRKLGLGPREMRLPALRISVEEEAAWRRARSTPTEAGKTASERGR